VFLDQIPRLLAVPAVSTWAEIEDVANGIIEEAYYGGGRALEVAVELTIQTENLFARAER
jgi:multiple sugar transport system substrate-binding protein